MTSVIVVPDGHVNFLQLADECRVIKTSPAWSEVKLALDWIDESKRNGRRIDAADARLDLLGRFRELIRSSAPVIEQAMLAGAAVGACNSAPTIGARMYHGLAAISRGYRFEHLDERAVEAALRRLRDSLVAEIPVLLEWKTMPASTMVLNSSPGSWTQAVGANLGKIADAVASFAFDMPGYEERAWNELRTRLQQGLVFQDSADPALASLFCVASGRMPSALLFEPTRLPVDQWGTLLACAVAASRPETAPPVSSPVANSTFPGWLTPLALHACGFRMPSDTYIARLSRANLPTQEASEWQRQWPWLFSGLPPRASALIVRRAAGSVVDGWLPRDQVAMLVVAADGVDRLVSIVKSRLSDDMSLMAWVGYGNDAVPQTLTHVVVEMPNALPNQPPGVTKGVEDLVRTLREVHGVQVVRLFAQAPSTMPSPADTVIVARNVDEFTSALLRPPRGRQ